MQAGNILFTFSKDTLIDRYGEHAIKLIKQCPLYRGETPKTISFEMNENRSRKEALSALDIYMRQYMEEFTKQLQDKFNRENKYAGKTIVEQ